MTIPRDKLRRIAVLDVGKSNVKAVLFADGHEDSARTMPNAVVADGPYPHFDTSRIQAFFIDALADLDRAGGFDAISITAHGAAGALLRGDELALPVLDYEFAGPDALAAEYDRIRPGFAESFSPRLPGGLNLGAQLFWQFRSFPAAFAAVTAFVTYPQFWAWWLTGVAATEPTSLGAHTDLWAPRQGGFSSMVSTHGWAARMAPLRSAFDLLGEVRPELARRIGLARPVPVACGLHDSNASLLPHLQSETGAFSVVSTGTWVIAFAPGGTLDGLDPARDTLANVDAFGRPVPSARFMGGREFDLLAGTSPGAPDAAAIEAVLERRIMALPTFVPGNGPFPHAPGRWTCDPATLAPQVRVAAASLYEALMTATSLQLAGASGPTIIEGPFARNDLFCDALECFTGRPVRAAEGGTGTSAGAAHLLHARNGALPHRVRPASLLPKGGSLESYASAWGAACGSTA